MSELHSLLTAVHRSFAGVYPDATARLAATGFVRALGGGVVAFTAEDLYKEGLQLDDASTWALTNHSPVTWEQTGGPGLAPAAHATSHQNGGSDEISVAGLSGVLADPQTPASHSHTSADVSDFNEAVEDRIGLRVVAGTGISVAYNDTTGETTITNDDPGSGVGGIGGTTGSTDNALLRADGTGGSTAQASNLTVPDDAATTEVGYLNIPQNSQSANYTLVIADRGWHIYHPVGDDNPRTWTIPANASVAFPVGTAITFVNDQNTITIAITSDTLVWSEDGSTGSRTLAENGMATAIKVTSTRWLISGTGLS